MVARAKWARGTKRSPRRPWSERDSDQVVLECGHITLPWGTIQALGSMAKEAYCDIENRWVPVWRKATLAERAGITVQPIPDECPF